MLRSCLILFVWLMAAIALWCVTSAFHGLTPALSEKLLWAKVQYLAIATVPPLWFAFLCEYVGATWAADRRIRIAYEGQGLDEEPEILRAVEALKARNEAGKRARERREQEQR